MFATFADLHVRKRATFADLHSYTHAYGSFILLNEAITIVFGSHSRHALSICLIWNFPNNLQVKRYSELIIVLLNVAPIPVCPKIMWHTGYLYLANKELKNYRPISILPFFSKLIEKCIFNRVYSFLCNNNIISKCQYGFRRNHSTSHTLMDLLDKIISAIDKKNLVWEYSWTCLMLLIL